MNKLLSLALIGAVALESGVEAKKHHKAAPKPAPKPHKKADKYAKDIVDTRIATHGLSAFYKSYVSKVLGSEEVGDCMGAASRQAL